MLYAFDQRFLLINRFFSLLLSEMYYFVYSVPNTVYNLQVMKLQAQLLTTKFEEQVNLLKENQLSICFLWFYLLYSMIKMIDQFRLQKV